MGRARSGLERAVVSITTPTSRSNKGLIMQFQTSSQLKRDAAKISYPCYQSLDAFIDLERLKSLDADLTEKLERAVKRRSSDLFLNEHRLDATSPHQPGAREIWLTRTKRG